ncbi:MAG: hypothetical protein MK345_01195 [SAR202 cluster bacterium]|nr:hypothetical protein [SAR202 cluster bacterium]
MFRIKTIAIFALTIFTFAIPFGSIAEANDPVVYGTVTFADDAGHNDSAIISVSGIAPGSYTASLISSDGQQFKLSDVDVEVATLQGVVQSTGSIDFTFDSSSAAYDGTNLLSKYSRFILENSSNTYSASNSYANSASVSALVSSINDAKESANSLKTNLETASSSTTLESIQTSVESSNSDISDLKTAVENISSASANVKSTDESLDVSGVDAIVTNINTWIASIEANNSSVSGTSSLAVAQTYVGSASGGSVADSHAILNGLPDKFEYDSDGNRVEIPGAGGIHKAIEAAQGLGSLSVIEGDLEASTIDGKSVNTSVLGLGLPSVGDKFLTITMQLSLVLGALLVVTSGGILLFKKN